MNEEARTPKAFDFDAVANEFAERGSRNPEYLAARRDARQRFELIDDLVALRKSKALTQAEVAAKMGVKQPTVSGFENEGSDPRISTIQRYARAVGARISIWHSISLGDVDAEWSSFGAGATAASYQAEVFEFNEHAPAVIRLSETA